MCASRLLILALISIIEIASTENPVKRETRLQPPPSLYPKPPPMSNDEDSRDSWLYNPSGDPLEKPHRRHRHKKMHHWSDPIRYKKQRGPKRLNKQRKPKKIHSIGKWPIGVHKKNPRYSDVPSTYLQPPNLLKSTYGLYTPREVPLADEPISSDPTQATDSLDNHRLNTESEEESEDHDRPTYIRDHAPEQQVDATGDIKANDNAETSREKSSSEQESPKERIDFHIQGHEGPDTYIFGFDTGVGSNRQFRLEERHEDGSVTGHYGYVDARGKLRKVRYKASPTQGYVEKHDGADEREV